MRYTVYFTLSLLLCSVTLWIPAQNLVPNPGFEQKLGCPENRKDIFQAIGWASAAQTPDFFHTCASGEAGVPINELGTQLPHTGKAYGGFWAFLPSRSEYREYLQIKLQRPLEAGEEYCLSAWLNLAEASEWSLEEIQVLFTDYPVYNPSNRIPAEESMVSLTHISPLDSKEKWVFMSVHFIAKGLEEYLSVGNFNDNLHTKILPTDNSETWEKLAKFEMASYYYIDDIGLFHLESDHCPCKKPEEFAGTTYEGLTSGSTVIMDEVFFTYDEAEILPESFPSLDELVAHLQANPEINIHITGHTDDQGEEEYNLELSRERALSIREYLLQKGLLESRISFEGKGNHRPVADNDTPTGRAQNRRVEIRFE